MGPATVGVGLSDPGFVKSAGRRGPPRLKVGNAVRIRVEWAGVEHLVTNLFNLLSGIVGKANSGPLQNDVKPRGVFTLYATGEILV